MTTSTTVPTIDMGPFLAGDLQAQESIAKRVAQTCEQTGFLIISGHGFPSGLFDTATQQLFDFFDLCCVSHAIRQRLSRNQARDDEFGHVR